MLAVSQVSTLGIMKQKCFCQCSRIHHTKYLCDEVIKLCAFDQDLLLQVSTVLLLDLQC